MLCGLQCCHWRFGQRLTLEIGAALDNESCDFMASVVFVQWLFYALVFPPPLPSSPSPFNIHEPVSLERKSDVSVYGKLIRLQFV